MMYKLGHLVSKGRNSSLSRYLLAICFLATVTCTTIFIVRKNRIKNEQIGEFIVPILPNWKQDVHRSDVVERIMYSNRVEGMLIHLSFYYFPQGNSKQDFSPENKKQILKSLKTYAHLLSAEGNKTTLLSVKEENSRFGRMLTITQRTIYNKYVTNQRNRYFYHNGKLYSMVSNLSGTGHSSKAVLAEKTGWDSLWEKIIPR